MVPGAGSMVRLARQLPYAHAMKILLGGEPISADQALAMGLVSEVVPLAQLQARAAEVAERVCGQAPLALQSQLLQAPQLSLIRRRKKTRLAATLQ